MRSLILSLVLAAVLAAPARGQQMTAQDSTLHALRGVVVVLVNPDSGLSNMAQQVESYVSLELRKAGLRVLAKDTDDSTAAALVISFQRRKNIVSIDVEMEITVAQFARLVRTGERFPVTTWRYKAEASQASSESAVAMQLLRPGVDQFLNGWLSANGR